MATLAGMTEKIEIHLSQSKKVFQPLGERPPAQ
jgi:hypothetical protein